MGCSVVLARDGAVGAVDPWGVGALVACNAVGDVMDPATGQVLAGARTVDGLRLLDTQRALMADGRDHRLLSGINTTIGVVATNASLTKPQAKRLAMSAHDDLARSVRPTHTTLDGDALFALPTGTENGTPDLMLLTVTGAEATALATVDAIRQAQGITIQTGLVPAAMNRIA